MIKKFKNGNIRMKVDNPNVTFDEFIEEMFWSDLYMDCVCGSYYFIDYNTQLVYDCTYLYVIRGDSNIFISDLQKGIKLYPYSKCVSVLLIADLEKDY